MIIISQDKIKIVNFDNIAHIFISKDSEKHYLIQYGKMNGGSELLGVYETIERAKQILQEITYKYQEYVQINSRATGVEGISVLPKKYEMPEE